MERSRNIKIPAGKGDKVRERSKAQRKDRLRRLMDDRLTEEISCHKLPFDIGQQEELLFELPISDDVKNMILKSWKSKIRSEVL